MSTPIVVYKVTSPSDRVYIGITINYEKRKYQHKFSKSNGKFQKALKKYGDMLKWEVIDSAKNYPTAHELEKRYILQFNSYKNGYNMTLGGEGHCGFVQTNKTIEKRKKSMIGKNLGAKRTEAHKKILSNVHTGNRYRRGSVQTESAKIKIKEGQRVKMKPVFCVTTKESFESMREACRKLNIDRSGLIKHLNNKNSKHVKGYTFTYLEK